MDFLLTGTALGPTELHKIYTVNFSKIKQTSKFKYLQRNFTEDERLEREIEIIIAAQTPKYQQGTKKTAD